MEASRATTGQATPADAPLAALTELAAPASEKDALRRRMLAAADLAAAAAAAGAILAATGEEPMAFWSLALLPAWVLVAKLHGLYDADHRHLRHLTVDELTPLFMWATVGTALTAFVLALLPTPAMSPAAAFAMWAAAYGSAFAFRGLARAAWRRLVAPERTLVLGRGDLARALERKLSLERGHHVRVVATAPPGKEPPVVVGGERIERIVLASEDLDESGLRDVTALCRAQRIKLSVAPPLPAMLGTAVTLTHLAELPLIEFKTWDPSRSTLFLKRLLDLALAAVAVLAIAPLLVAIAVAVRLDSRGPALFRQRRAGLDGRPFTMLKFRTMVADAEARLGELVDVDDLPEPMFKLREDPRVTRVGRLLRRTSLDELPQLLNVLRGNMSLVGPRPEELRLAERYGPDERVRLQTRPGITGPMQVHGRGELTFAERLAVEREYVENHALRKDVIILLKTAGAVLRRTGAF